MYSIWTKHLRDQQDKDQYTKSLRNSKWILEDLDKILVSMKDELDTSETNPKTYDIPNWDYRQAHNNGYRQCLNLIRKLITIEHKDPNAGQHSITSTD